MPQTVFLQSVGRGDKPVRKRPQFGQSVRSDQCLLQGIAKGIPNGQNWVESIRDAKACANGRHDKFAVRKLPVCFRSQSRPCGQACPTPPKSANPPTAVSRCYILVRLDWLAPTRRFSRHQCDNWDNLRKRGIAFGRASRTHECENCEI